MIWRLKYLFRSIKLAWQRIRKGYDDISVWNFQYDFIYRTANILEEMKQNLKSRPFDLTMEEWESIIDRMCTCVKMMDCDYVYDELEKISEPADSKEMVNRMNESKEIAERNKKEFFELFEKHFYNLWI